MDSPRSRARSIPGRAQWAWEPTRWRDAPESLWRALAENGVTTVYISVPQRDGVVEGPNELSAFVAASAQRGVHVWAVEGDPHAVTPAGRARYLARTAALATYQRQAPSSGRLTGLQHDIEPYLLPEYVECPDAVLGDYLDTLRALQQAADGLALEVAVPHWWVALRDAQEGLPDAIAPYVDGLTVMVYRNQADEIRAIARTWLDWAETADRPVRIALEAGPIADASARAVTFHHDPEALRALLPVLEAEFMRSPAFAGVALHELWTPLTS